MVTRNMNEYCIPRATYRLQFNKNFTFAQASAIIPYLSELGVSHIYASPYLKARAGSTHGYDIIDHNALNPELGDMQTYETFTQSLDQNHMGQILDIVPNHMGVHGADNRWWLDVLENGRSSAYADFFDIDWSPLHPRLQGKILLPILGDHYGKVLERGELQLRFDVQSAQFSLYYYEHRFPVDPRSYGIILERNLLTLRAHAGLSREEMMEFESLIAAFHRLPPCTEIMPGLIEERNRDMTVNKKYLANLCAHSDLIRQHIERQTQLLNETHADSMGSNELHALLENQSWRLAFWRVAGDEINYRRFFDINDLAAVRMEHIEVFETTHRLILQLIESGKIHGLRIDHPDGLYDPEGYFIRLKDAIAERISSPEPFYILAEKILADHESLPEEWPISGTTGYEFGRLLNGLFIDGSGEETLDSAYLHFIRQPLGFAELLYQHKKLIIRTVLSSELHVLANQLDRLTEADPFCRDFTLAALRNTLREIIACFPVYRTYISHSSVSKDDRRHIEWAVALAKKRQARIETSVYDFVQSVLTMDWAEDNRVINKAELLDFIMRFQQYTSPVMAKGLEDTTGYIYNRLVSANEVGGNPSKASITVSAFHHQNHDRLRRWPDNMLASTTHDSKRSEDVRARINIISEMPQLWTQKIEQWHRFNRSRKSRIETGEAPNRNHEYLFYQTLLGSWPFTPVDDPGWNDYCHRIEGYMLKAAREGKTETSWITPDLEYEQALKHFVNAVLDRSTQNPFLSDFDEFQRPIAYLGMFNSLAQITLKYTSPGVPDIYQGNETWDFSLVDPDNRRPVNYTQVIKMLRDITLQPEPNPQRYAWLMGHMESGCIKFEQTWHLLQWRRNHSDLFRHGSYIAIEAQGKYSEHVCAYLRKHGDHILLIAVPRLIYQLTEAGSMPPMGEIWEDTRIQIPVTLSSAGFSHLLTGERFQTTNDQWLSLHEATRSSPFIIMHGTILEVD